MIILVTGASHTGKTALAQKLLEKYKYPYLSIDHLKMGLIRSGNTTLTPVSDENALTEYLKNMKYYCLVMSKKYIMNHFGDIKKYANVVENRINDEDCTIETVLRDNTELLERCQNYNVNYLLIDDEYQVDIEL